MKIPVNVLIRDETLQELLKYKETTNHSLSFIVENAILILLSEQGISVNFKEEGL